MQFFLSRHSLRLKLHYRSFKQRYRENGFLSAIHINIKGLSAKTRILLLPGILSAAYIFVALIISAVSVYFSSMVPDLFYPQDVSGVRAIWQAQTTIVSFSLVVLVFSWEYLRDDINQQKVQQAFLKRSRSIPIISGSLWLVVGSGLFILALRTGGSLNAVFFHGVMASAAITFVLLLMLFGTIVSAYFFDEDRRYIRDDVKNDISGAFQPSIENLEKTILESTVGYSTTPPIMPIRDNTHAITASDIDVKGAITDIHLQKLSECVNTINNEAEGIVAIPQLGRALSNDDRVVLTYRGDLAGSAREEVEDQLKSSLKIANQ